MENSTHSDVIAHRDSRLVTFDDTRGSVYDDCDLIFSELVIENQGNQSWTADVRMVYNGKNKNKRMALFIKGLLVSHGSTKDTPPP